MRGDLPYYCAKCGAVLEAISAGGNLHYYCPVCKTELLEGEYRNTPIEPGEFEKAQEQIHYLKAENRRLEEIIEELKSQIKNLQEQYRIKQMT